jgi:hypothetical protein
LNREKKKEKRKKSNSEKEAKMRRGKKKPRRSSAAKGGPVLKKQRANDQVEEPSAASDSVRGFTLETLYRALPAPSLTPLPAPDGLRSGVAMYTYQKVLQPSRQHLHCKPPPSPADVQGQLRSCLLTSFIMLRCSTGVHDPDVQTREGLRQEGRHPLRGDGAVATEQAAPASPFLH